MLGGPSLETKVIPFSIPQAEHAIKDLYTAGIFTDGGATLLEKLEGDIVDLSIKGMVNQLCLPDPVKCFLDWIPKYIPPSRIPKLASILKRFVEWGHPRNCGSSTQQWRNISKSS
ncbi:vitamin D3 hydroxylase-associated protein-like [Nomascus leucogenys]|uniref:vitamin D3 hydroxylase-associated protein-like n=1 Tax=Nomascus leucogenys TaxID=61853 RepID=UPI00122D58AE|nr:vitamin D3 hydroxylase-associated protein-like [Nomascus leucogenys]